MTQGSQCMDEIHRHLTSFKIGIAVGLTEKRDGSQFYLSSGFVCDFGDAGKLIITCGHSNRSILRWHKEGIVCACCIYHHSNQHEDTLVEYPLDLDTIQHQFDAASDEIDAGIVYLEPELVKSLDSHGVPSARFREDFEVPDLTCEGRRFQLLVAGFSVDGTTVTRVPTIPYFDAGHLVENERWAPGLVRSRFVQIQEWRNEPNGQYRLIPTPQDQPSVKGMSGGPLLFFSLDDVDNLRIMGIQIREFRPKDKIEYLIANNNETVIRAIMKMCIARNR